MCYINAVCAHDVVCLIKRVRALSARSDSNVYNMCVCVELAHIMYCAIHVHVWCVCSLSSPYHTHTHTLTHKLSLALCAHLTPLSTCAHAFTYRHFLGLSALAPRCRRRVLLITCGRTHTHTHNITIYGFFCILYKAI